MFTATALSLALSTVPMWGDEDVRVLPVIITEGQEAGHADRGDLEFNDSDVYVISIERGDLAFVEIEGPNVRRLKLEVFDAQGKEIAAATANANGAYAKWLAREDAVFYVRVRNGGLFSKQYAFFFQILNGDQPRLGREQSERGRLNRGDADFVYSGPSIGDDDAEPGSASRERQANNDRLNRSDVDFVESGPSIGDDDAEPGSTTRERQSKAGRLDRSALMMYSQPSNDGGDADLGRLQSDKARKGRLDKRDTEQVHTGPKDDGGDIGHGR